MLALDRDRRWTAFALAVALMTPACRMDSHPERTGAADSAEQVRIGDVLWYVDYEAAVEIAREQDQALWVHFGENPGWEGCQHFASGPLRDPRIVAASEAFVPVFVDTLDRSQPYQRFGESYGSYPVLRIHDHAGQDLAGRLDGNPVRGRIPIADVLEQMERGKSAYRR